MSFDELLNEDSIERLSKILPDGDMDNVVDLSRSLANPRGWVPDPAFPLILIPPPERVSIFPGPMSGFEIRGGDTYAIENGKRRKLEGWEAIQMRQNARMAFGESIADMIGLEPE